MTSIRASIVMPSYNHAPYIERAIDSVLAAMPDHEQFELVIVDDGSTDDTLARLERFGSDPRIKTFPRDNQGANAALNRGLKASCGEIVFVLNSDDAYSPERIPRFLDRFDRDPDLMMLASWIEIIDERGDTVGVKQAWANMPPWPRPRRGPGLAELGDPVLALLETNYVSTTSNFAFRRQVFDQQVFQPLRYTHDWDFLLAVCSRYSVCSRPAFALIEEPLVSYRVHGANTIREGAEQEHARGQMRFEILWSVARHALAVCRARVARGEDEQDLYRRLWNSLPRFGHDTILAQLLALRGNSEDPPAAYEELLKPENPWRQAAIRALGGEEQAIDGQ